MQDAVEFAEISPRAGARDGATTTSMSDAQPRILTFREALREAMVEEMERDDAIFLMGEEVGHYNGAYKVSEGMLERFGEKRVIDTPIAETRLRGRRHRRGDDRAAADHRVHDLELLARRHTISS